jgi:L-asparaginase
MGRQKSTPIRIFVTGGTFDKEYDELRGQLYFRDTHVPEMLRLGRCRLDVSVRTLMMIDSLDMTDEDRATIVDHCRRCAEERIVITHGTDTMVETARALAQGVTGKTIVLTGAMVPYAFGSSDGLFNLGSALSFVQVLPPGVYIAMNGRWFPWYDVRKNRETGVFEPLGNEPNRPPEAAPAPAGAAPAPPEGGAAPSGNEG